MENFDFTENEDFQKGSNGQTRTLNALIDQRFTNTKAGLIGVHRESMLKNELHLLSELGKSRRRGHQLPPESFTYGISFDQFKGCNLADVISHRENVVSDSKSQNHYKVVRDFVALNKAALKSGCTNAKENNIYHSSHDIKKHIRMRAPELDARSKVFTNKMDEIPSHLIFGKRNRSPTPIHDIINHHFLNDWYEKAMANEVSKVENKQKLVETNKGTYHTKASLLKNVKITTFQKPIQIPKRLKEIQPMIDSFQNNLSRQNSYSANYLDKISMENAVKA